MDFDEPRALLLAPLLWGLVLLLGRRSLAGLMPGRARLALGARLALVTLVAAALAGPAWTGAADRRHVVVTVDRSRSIPSDLEAEAAAVAAAVAAHVEGGRTAGLVGFGGDASNEGPLTPPTTEVTGAAEVAFRGVVDRDATDLARALRAAEGTLPPEARGRVLLVSDGNATAGDALAAATALRRDGLVVDVVPLRYGLRDEVAVEKVVAPDEVAPGEEAPVRVVLWARDATPATVSLFAEGALVAARRTVVGPGPSVEAFVVRAGPMARQRGLLRLEATVAPDDAASDARPQNNVGHAFVRVPGAARVLWVRPEEADTSLTAPAPPAPGVEPVRPRDLPADAAGYEAVAAVALDGVPRADLSLAQVRALVGAVADLGVGLLLVGGPDALGAGDWAGTPLEEASPVLFAPADPTVLPDVGLVLVVDRSGSMEGEKLDMARQAAAGAAARLGPRDGLGVVAFDSTPAWIVPLATGRAPALVRELLAGLDAGGGTDLDPALRLAGLALGERAFAVRHVLLLTDGQSPGSAAPSIALALRAQGITTSTIAVGADADRELLKQVARAGRGRALQVDRPTDLPRVVLTEATRVARALVHEEPFVPAPKGAPELLRGLPAPPGLLGLVRTEAKPRAQVELLGPDGAPVLAQAPFGLGTVVAFTSDSGARWSAGWRAWPAHDAFWERLVRAVRAQVERSEWAVRAVRGRGEARVIVEAVDADGTPRDGLELVARVRGPRDAEAREVPLAGRGLGRYEAALDAGEVGAWSVTVMRRAGADLRHVATTGLVVAYPDELGRLESDEGALAALAAAGGGRVVAPWDVREGRWDPWADLPPRRGARPLWPGLLALTVAVLLLDVAVRRVDLPWRRLVAASPARPGPPRAAAPIAPAAGEAPSEPASTVPRPPTVATGEGASPPARGPGDGAPAGAEGTTARLLDLKRRRGGGA